MAHLQATVSCKRNVHVHWETKTFMGLALLQNLLYCYGLEANPQYL